MNKSSCSSTSSHDWNRCSHNVIPGSQLYLTLVRLISKQKHTFGPRPSSGFHWVLQRSSSSCFPLPGLRAPPICPFTPEANNIFEGNSCIPIFQNGSGEQQQLVPHWDLSQKCPALFCSPKCMGRVKGVQPDWLVFGSTHLFCIFY